MKLYSPNTDLDETELGGNFSTCNPRRIYVGLTLGTRVPVSGGGESVEGCKSGCWGESTWVFPGSKCDCDRREKEKESHSDEPMVRGIQMN